MVASSINQLVSHFMGTLEESDHSPYQEMDDNFGGEEWEVCKEMGEKRDTNRHITSHVSTTVISSSISSIVICLSV